MTTMTIRRPLLLLVSALLLTFGSLAAAEPPSRVARLGYTSGTVSFSPAGQPDWVQAAVNRPLTTGDRLWTEDRSRAELQIGGAAIRLGPGTDMTLLNLDDHITQVMLAQGTLKLRVRRLGPDQSFEINTPNLAFTLHRPGEYRIEVDANDDATAVMVQSGEAEVYGDRTAYTVRRDRAYRFYGTDLADYEILSAQADDELDRWSRERDRRIDRSSSARYVSAEVVGYEDLDANGTWRVDPNYGNVWIPNRVSVGWTPYRDGHWAWIDPWGWTWVDDAPWGFAVSHYGRWAHIQGSWGWVPGPPRERAVYAPALVAFVGGNNFRLSISVGSPVTAAVGWFPLAPREVYRPSYPVSRSYFDNINRSNAVIAPTTITNIYNTTIVNNTTNIVNVRYANQQVNGAVVAVPAQAFVQSQPVARAKVQLSRELAISAPVAHVAAVAPVEQSVHGGAGRAAARPPAREHAVVARTAPPPPSVPFAVQQRQLAARPGRPIDAEQRTQLKPAAAAVPAPKVSVVATVEAPKPAALPPETPPARRSRDARRTPAGGSAANEAAAGKAAEAKDADADAGAARAESRAARANATKEDAARVEAAKAEAARADTARAEADKVERARSDASKADVERAERARSNGSRAEADKAERARSDASKVEVDKAERARSNASRAEAAQAAAGRAAANEAAAGKAAEAAAADARAAARAEASRAARDNATKADAARVEAGRAESARANADKAERGRSEDSKAEADKAERARSSASRAEAAQAAAGRAAANEAAAGKAAEAAAADAKAARAEASRVARDNATKADAARVEAGRAESAARANVERAERARSDASKAEADKAERARSSASRAEAAQAAAGRAAANEAAAAKAAEARATDAKAEAKAPRSPSGAAPPPKARASGPKSDADEAADERKRARDEDRKR